MEDLKTEEQNLDLAAALFFLLGEAVPHSTDFEKEASGMIDEIKDREKLLLKIIQLCGTPHTPKQLYLLEKAYSWLGKKYDKETVEFAGRYLHTEGWDELPKRIKAENGISVNHAAAHRASVFIDLAKAQEGLEHLDLALSNFQTAYQLEPYNAMAAIKIADVLTKMRGKEEALQFLIQQKGSIYYSPVKYTDAFGTVHHNDLFKQLLDAHILKLKENK